MTHNSLPPVRKIHFPAAEDTCFWHNDWCRFKLPILENVIGTASIGIFGMDLNKNIFLFNRKAGRITAFDPRKLLGTKCYEFARTASCYDNCCLEKALAGGKESVSSQAIILDKNGQKIPIRYSASLIRDERGKPLGWVESFIDVRFKIAIGNRPSVVKDFIGRDEQIAKILERLPVVALSGASILIGGETGTGKDILARLIHDRSQRADGPFVKVNCAALPDHLLESELFGYKKGAFTDAKKDKAGRFQLANSGTIFLDEIGDLSLNLQAKLLQVLDEMEFYPLGSTIPVNVDARIIAATNRNLKNMVKEFLFRQDLYFRLNVIEINLPPLRERPSDIPLLSDHFLKRFASLYDKTSAVISPDLLRTFQDYPFPGNTRELKNIIEHAVIVNRNGVIGYEDCPRDFIESTKSVILNWSSETRHNPQSEPLIYEKKSILKELSDHRWRIQETAEALKIDRTTLWRKMKKYGLLSS